MSKKQRNADATDLYVDAQTKITRLESEVERLREVLEFYAQGGNFQTDIWKHEELGYFTGKRARAALQAEKESE